MQLSDCEDAAARGARTSTVTEPDADVRIYADALFDAETRALRARPCVAVHAASGLILAVREWAPGDVERDADVGAVDLRGTTLLPGLVDAHVHLFLHPYDETPWAEQLTKEPEAERVVRATVHARRTLLAGFTTVRDLGTEGAGDADVALRVCMAGPAALVPGPRYFCANRALVATGTYGPRSSVRVAQEGVDGVMGAEAADGVDACVRAVRRQIGAGADWIKIYADYRVRARAALTSRDPGNASMPTFAEAETAAMIAAAHQYGVKVAAHATNRATVRALLAQGVDSIEHGYDVLGDADGDENDDDAEAVRSLFAAGHATWVPTLAAYHALGRGPGGAWERAARAFRAAVAAGLENVATGGDTGVFAHGDNARELGLMVQLGADWRRVLQWATLGGWRCVRSMTWEGEAGARRLARVGELAEDQRVVGENEVPFGVIRRGFAADIIATKGDLEKDFEGAVAKKNIVFVMKGGRIFKQDGRAVELE